MIKPHGRGRHQQIQPIPGAMIRGFAVENAEILAMQSFTSDTSNNALEGSLAIGIYWSTQIGPSPKWD